MSDKWDEVKKKIQNLEQDPFLDDKMLRTMDTISIADYWRRRFQEEHALLGQIQANDSKKFESSDYNYLVGGKILNPRLAHGQLFVRKNKLCNGEPVPQIGEPRRTFSTGGDGGKEGVVVL